jgi:hypothetical protein
VSERPDLLPHELRALGAAALLALILLAAVTVDQIGTFLMKRLFVFAAAAALTTASLGLSGCAGLSAFNTALIPQLKPVDAKIHTDTTCGDMAAQVMGITETELTAKQAVAIVQFCERRDATQTLTLDPQGARRVLAGALNGKGAASLAVGSVVP